MVIRDTIIAGDYFLGINLKAKKVDRNFNHFDNLRPGCNIICNHLIALKEYFDNTQKYSIVYILGK